MPLLFTGNFNGEPVTDQRISAEQVAELAGMKKELDRYRKDGKMIEFRLLPDFVQEETADRSYGHIKNLKMPTRANFLINGTPSQVQIYTGIRNLPNSIVPEYRYGQSNKIELDFRAGPAILLDPVTQYELVVFLLLSPLVQTPYVQFAQEKYPRLFWFKRDEFIQNQLRLKTEIGKVRAEMLSASPLRQRLFIQGVNALMKRTFVVQDETDIMFAMDAISEQAAEYMSAWGEPKTFYVGAIMEAFNRGVLEVVGGIGQQSVRYRSTGTVVCELGFGESYYNALYNLMQETGDYAATLFAWSGITEEEVKGLPKKETGEKKAAATKNDAAQKGDADKNAKPGVSAAVQSVLTLVEGNTLKIHQNGAVAHRASEMDTWEPLEKVKVKMPLDEQGAILILDKLGK